VDQDPWFGGEALYQPALHRRDSIDEILRQRGGRYRGIAHEIKARIG